MNVGLTPTCVRPQGSSIVDLTWASPDTMSFIEEWKVREDLESLSDHLYISFKLRTGLPLNKLVHRKWNLRKFDSDFFETALVWKSRESDVEDRMDVTQMRKWLDSVMEEACDAAAPRIGPRRPRRSAYW
ncbi:reverse transcriptase [Lasius niger]|uniref:Reverse transcriptase n=1 Tax=Lasius niger TaxID=67767 RepID=A0A0J7KXR3_LASNI|nr:reverse transcriptase [Lasius niger]